MTHKVSLYIPCYNVEKYLTETLQGVLAQTYPPTEILIIDDGSIDQTAKIAQTFPVRLIQHNGNKGLATARNTAIQEAKYEFIASVDADVVPESDWLEILLQAFSDQNTAGVGGKLIELKQNTVADRWRSLEMRQDLGEQPMVIRFPKNERLSGFGTVFRKSALEAVGGYDERYTTSFEDVDISQKLLKAGYTLIYKPEAIAYHIRQDNIYSVLRTAWNWKYWPEFHYGSYDLSLESIRGKFTNNFRWTDQLIRYHMQTGKISLLSVDLAFLFLYCYWDARYFIKQVRKPWQNHI